MTLVVPNTGEVIALEYLVNKNATQRDVIYNLYQSNTTPAETDTAGDYTAADFTGYSAITLTGASWTVTGGAPSDASYAQQTWTSSADQSAQTVYGYYVTRVTDADLVWAERFTSAPFVIENDGDTIKITPTITAD